MRLSSRRTVALVAVVGLLGGLVMAPSIAAAQNDRTKDLIDLIVSGNRLNSSQIHSLRAEYEDTLENPDVPDGPPTTRKYTKDDGVTVEYTVAAKSMDVLSCIFKGDKRRYDQYADGGAGPLGTWVYDDRGVLQYVPERQIAWLRPHIPSVTKALPVLDPRDFGLPDGKCGLSDMLLHDRIIEARTTADASGQDVVRVELTNAYGQRVTLTFSPLRNCLPSSITYHHPDGSVAFSTDYEYAEVAPNAVWFPSQATCRFYSIGQAKVGTEDGWKQRHSIHLRGKIVLNQDVNDDEFNITLPKGTLLHDDVSHKMGVLGESTSGINPIQPARWTLIWMALGIGLIVSLALGVYLARRLRRR